MGLEEFIAKVSGKLNKIKVGVLIRIDIFEMGYLNIIHGFEKGNILLKAVEKILKEHIRETDLVAKTGGDEFALFIELSKEENVSAIAEKIYRLFTYPIEGIQIFMNAGISVFPVDGKTFTELFEKAGFALKEAKKRGPNVINFYTEVFEKKISEILKIETLIEKAIKEDLFKIYYHPFFDAKTLEIQAFEALLRIVGKDGKIHPAKDFIHILEKHPYMNVVEEKIIKEAVENSKKWGVPVAINLSEIGFITGGFLEKLIKYCEPGCKIIIEIVERMVIKDPKHTIEFLNKLREIGFKVAIDDFGAGYSLLAYLKELPFDILKIDKSFIEELSYNDRAKAIVEIIVTLSKKMSVKVCAEGVEKEEQLEFLRSIDCDCVQGFLFGEPLCQEEIEKRYLKDLKGKQI